MLQFINVSQLKSSPCLQKLELQFHWLLTCGYQSKKYINSVVLYLTSYQYYISSFLLIFDLRLVGAPLSEKFSLIKLILISRFIISSYPP